ncbi:hypothetical protein JKF63_07741 [Porcisia hertigi]|uniref:Transmembrane protein n=1 Tax=Porcisia hertigi TaxID=2761500 RepID=A0A836LLR1_9TRYP|nr:hypothetical protein JKF63_07741 [Porcisia hertigi]
MLVNVSACPYYPLWSLLAGNGTVEEPVNIPARKEKEEEEEEAGGRTRRPHVDMASRAKVAGRLDASMEDATEGRNRGATKAALRDLTRTLSGQRSALTSYYETLNADRPFVMLQGATIHITIDTSVSLFYHVTTFREHIASNTLRVSPTGGGGSVNDLSRARRTPPSSASTRSSIENVDDDDDDDGTDDETYPDISLQTVFFFWNWPTLHCTFNAPALMSTMIDLANEQGTAVPRLQLRNRPPRAAKSNFVRPMPLGHDTALAEGKAGRTVDEAAANPPPASSEGGSPVYPSCAASMPPPKNILPPEPLNNSFLQDIMQLNTAVVLKIFRFDVWYQLTNTPVPSSFAAARMNTDAAAAAQASAAYSTLFSSDTATTRSGDGRSTGSLDANPSHNLRANAERVCTAPALYTIPLNALLARASSWNLGSAADWLQSSVGVTHNYPGAPVIAVVAQCSGIPLSFAVTVNFVNPGNYAGSGEHIPTAIMFLSLLACYVILLIVFLVMILSCSKQRQCCGAGVKKDEKGHTSPSDDGPRQATAAHGERQTPTGSDQRPANREMRSSASKPVWGRGRERRGDTAAEGAGRKNRHRQDNDKEQELQVMGAGEANAGTRAAPHGAEGKGVKVSSRDSSEWTSWAETAVDKAHVLTLRHTADIHQDVTEDEPIRTEAGKSGGGRVGPRPRQTHQDERPVGGDLRRDDESDNSLRCQSPFYSMRSSTSSPLSSDDDGRRDTTSGQSDARKEEAREGLSGRGSGSAQSSQRRRTPTSSSVTYSSSSSSSSIYSCSSADDDTDCSSSSTSGGDDDDDDSNRDEGRSARCRHRQKRQREAEARRRRGHEQRKRGIPARTTALSTTNALVSPRRWRSRVVRMTDFVLSKVVEPLRLRWAKSHIIVMYPPMQWLVLALLMLKCLLSVFFSAHFALLAGLRLTASIGRSLALAGIILQVATQSLLIPTEMLVAMGWGLAFTAHMPTNKTVVVHLSTFVMFIVYVLAATCGDNGLNMALTANRYTKIINGNYCNTVEYMRAALELLLSFHNVLRMFFLSMWLSKTVIPADAAAAQRQRHLRQKQAQHAQRKSTEEKDRGAAGTDISTGDKASNQYDSRHRAPSASSSGRRHDPRSVSTTDDVSSSPISLPPPPRLAYPDVTLSAMDVYLRYRGMRLPFAMLLLWPVLLLVFSFTFYDLEDYYMVVALREVHTLHLLGFIIMFFRTSSPLYF